MRAVDNFPIKDAILIHCAECNAGLLLPPNRAKTRKFCTRDCLYAFQRKQRAAGLLAGPPGHRTDEGRQRSLSNLIHDATFAAALWHDRPHQWVQCHACQQQFPTRANPLPRFCSERCRQQAMTREGRYTVEKPCAICTTTFKTGKYRPAQTCSRRCARLFVLQAAHHDPQERACQNPPLPPSVSAP